MWAAKLCLGNVRMKRLFHRLTQKITFLTPTHTQMIPNFSSIPTQNSYSPLHRISISFPLVLQDSKINKLTSPSDWTAGTSTNLRALLTLDEESGTTGARVVVVTGATVILLGVRGLLIGDSNTKPISCLADFSRARLISAMIPSTASTQLRLIPDVMAESVYSPSLVYKDTEN